MKKLMIAAATAAMIGGAFAGTCDDESELCVAYDVQLKAKTLVAKKATCKTVCDDKETYYYLDDGTRTIKGYAWACDYTCGDDLNLALWDAKNADGIYVYGVDDALAFGDGVIRYSKKANKVAAAFELGTDKAEIMLAGTKGTLKEMDGEMVIKSLSGNFAGTLDFIVPELTVTKTVKTSKNICEDDAYDVIDCDDLEVLVFNLCDCDTDYCEDGVTFDGELVPAYGTWSIKYNSKIAAGKKGKILGLIPSYAK